MQPFNNVTPHQYMINKTKLNQLKTISSLRDHFTKESSEKACPDYDVAYSHVMKDFFDQSTLSGISQIVSRRKIGWKYFWVFVSISGLMMSLWQSYDVMVDYARGKTIHVVDYGNQEKIEFPSVTVCSGVRVHHSRLTPDFAMEFCNGSSYEYCLRKRQSSKPNREAEEMFTNDRLIKQQVLYSAEERWQRFYEPDFLTISMTVNMDRKDRKMIFNEMYAKYWIHSPGTAPPVYTENWEYLKPGDKIKIQFFMRNISRANLAECYEPSNKKYQELSYFYSEATPYLYDYKACAAHMLDENLFSKNKCYHPAIPYPNLKKKIWEEKGRFCSRLYYDDCIETCYNFTNWEIYYYRSKCKQPCRVYHLMYTVNTVSLWLENVIENSMQSEYMSSDPISDNSLREEIENRSVAVLEIVPWSHVSETVNEEYRYSYSDFLGILGGNIGLWIGVSVISLTEIIEMVYLITSVFINRQIAKRHRKREKKWKLKTTKIFHFTP